MIVDVDVKWVKELDPTANVIKEALRWKQTGRYKLDLRMLSDAEQDKLVDIAGKMKGSGFKAVGTALTTFRMMKDNPTGIPIKSLKMLEAALIEHFIANAPRKWVFVREGAHRMPYYVKRIEWNAQKREHTYVIPEHVNMFLESQDASLTIKWEVGDLEGGTLTVIKLLTNEKCRTENDKLVEAYQAEMDKFAEYSEMVGAQFSAVGTADSVGDYWYSSKSGVAMERDGMPSKVVIDDGSEPERTARNRGGHKTVDDKFWNTKADHKRAGGSKGYHNSRGRWVDQDDDGDDDGEPKDNVIVLPEHPWVRVFDLQQHQFLDIHVNDLSPYEFDDALGTKLVLPEDEMTVLDALVHGSENLMEDIVKGKTGGTIVMCTGDPGTGKTLSAEVFAEKMHKPLYTVQCSQLGLNPEELEKQLGIVLARANRWKCILLIDEADVYVRARGEDIEQNAMVGVWLRLLEYYRGVMFLTSNRVTMIDDAVMSRATAWIRYPRPDADALARIWAVLLAQYEMETPSELIPDLVSTWPHATGRNVKNLIKLARSLGAHLQGKEPFELFEMAARFIDIPDHLGEEVDG